MRPITLLSGLALGALTATAAGAEPLELTDAQMDAVTAGATAPTISFTRDGEPIASVFAAAAAPLVDVELELAGGDSPCLTPVEVTLSDGTVLPPGGGGQGDPF